MISDKRLKFDVLVKWHGRWSLVAKCLCEFDARLVADDRAKDVDKREVNGVKVMNGEKLVYQLG